MVGTIIIMDQILIKLIEVEVMTDTGQEKGLEKNLEIGPLEKNLGIGHPEIYQEIGHLEKNLGIGLLGKNLGTDPPMIEEKED